MTAIAEHERISAEAPVLPTSDAARPRGRAKAARWRVAAVTVIWATSLVIVALWVLGGNVQALTSSVPDALNSLGRIAGLVSANLLLYQVLLMARVPLFERGFGHDGIVRLHRVVGYWSFWLLCAHLVLQVFGYAGQAGINPFVQLWEFVWDYPGMLLATVGTLLLILVVVTSMRRARRRLRYESWHLLHLYGYLGVGLAIPHMLWTGADFAANPVATAYWWGLWAATAASVLIWRIGVPLWRSWRHDIRVERAIPDGAQGVEVTMRGRGLSRLRIEPGQFFVWRFLDGAGWSRGHPFSLAAAPDGERLTLSARLVGDGTARLAALRPGTRVLIEGPYGTLTGARRAGSRLLMLGAGAGVAPLLAILEGERYAPGTATLITRDHTDDAGLQRRRARRLVEERGVRHFTINGPRSQGPSSWLPASHDRWRGQDLLRHVAGDIHACDVYLCGPEPWMKAVRADLRAAGVTPDRIHTESFTV